MLIHPQSSLLRGIAAEGIAKLLLNGRVLSQKLVAKLLLLWYNPVTQGETSLMAVLGTFFTAFAAADRCGHGSFFRASSYFYTSLLGL